VKSTGQPRHFVQHRLWQIPRCLPRVLLCMILPGAGTLAATAQHGAFPVGAESLQTQLHASQSTESAAQPANESQNTEPEAALQLGIALCGQARFAEAVAPLQRAQGRVAEVYAAQFNLSLAYRGIGQWEASVDVLQGLLREGGETAAVDDLLAQDEIALGNVDAGYSAAQRAQLQTRGMPQEQEKLFAYLADACTDKSNYALGLRLMDLGLEQASDSARLHYERALFLAQLDRIAEARPEFVRAQMLGGKTLIGSLAAVQALLYDDRYAEAVAIARHALAQQNAFATPTQRANLQTVLGSILLEQGAVLGEAAFSEAQQVLENAVQIEPASASAQIALGKLYLRCRAYEAALVHLEAGERLQPQNTALYPALATAYRHLGRPAKADSCMQMLAGLLREQKLEAIAAPATR
jgi:lipopolysaccharide biosynthesis regulator YciM